MLCLYSKKVHDDVHPKFCRVCEQCWKKKSFQQCTIYFSPEPVKTLPPFLCMSLTSVTRTVLGALVVEFQHPVRNRNQVDLQFVMHACVGVECTPT